MAPQRPRTRQAIAPLESEPSSPSPAPASRPASTSQDSSDPGDASGSDDADEPAHGDYNLYVNNPDAIPILRKSAAPDIRFFFDKSGPMAVCRVCK